MVVYSRYLFCLFVWLIDCLLVCVFRCINPYISNVGGKSEKKRLIWESVSFSFRRPFDFEWWYGWFKKYMILQQISRGKEILHGNLPEKNSCTEKKKKSFSLLSKHEEQWTVFCETKLLVLARQLIVAKNRTAASVKRCTLYVKRNVSFGQEAQWIPECSSVDRSFRYLFTNHTEVHSVHLRQYTCLLKSRLFSFWYSTNKFNRYVLFSWPRLFKDWIPLSTR